MPTAETRMRDCLKLVFRPDSQTPSITLRIKPKTLDNNAQSYMYNVFANSLHRTEQEIGLRFSYGADAAVMDNLPADPELQRLAKLGKIWRINVDMYEANTVPTSGAVRDPTWNNISQEERDTVAES